MNHVLFNIFDDELPAQKFWFLKIFLYETYESYIYDFSDIGDKRVNRKCSFTCDFILFG